MCVESNIFPCAEDRTNTMDVSAAEQYYMKTKKLFEKYRDMRWIVIKATTNAVRTLSSLNAEYGLENVYAKQLSAQKLEEGEETEAKVTRVAGELLEGNQILMIAGRNKAASHVNGILRTTARTKEYLDAIDMAAEFMRKNHKKGEVYYWILYYNYFSPQKISGSAEIIELMIPHTPKQQAISNPTYTRWLRGAIEVMSSILWGYDLEEYAEITKNLPRNPNNQKADVQ